MPQAKYASYVSSAFIKSTMCALLSTIDTLVAMQIRNNLAVLMMNRDKNEKNISSGQICCWKSLPCIRVTQYLCLVSNKSIIGFLIIKTSDRLEPLYTLLIIDMLWHIGLYMFHQGSTIVPSTIDV